MKRIVTIITSIAIVSGIAWYISKRNNHTPTPASENGNILIVGTNATFPPFSFERDNEIVGFDIDIIQEVANRIGKKLSLQNMSFEALIPQIQLGNIHVIAAGMTPTEERAKRLFFTKPHFDKDPLVAIQPVNAQPISRTNQLADKVIIVNQGYTADRFVSEIPHIKDIIRISSPYVSTCILALQSGKADLYVTAQSTIKLYFEQNSNSPFMQTPIENSEEIYALAVSKNIQRYTHKFKK
jgi:ABC-type amino acid transport/signal transduction systems, periplasmic component/domain